MINIALRKYSWFASKYVDAPKARGVVALCHVSCDGHKSFFANFWVAWCKFLKLLGRQVVITYN